MQPAPGDRLQTRCCWCVRRRPLCPTGSISLSRGTCTCTDDELAAISSCPDPNGIQGPRSARVGTRPPRTTWSTPHRQAMRANLPVRVDNFDEIVDGYDQAAGVIEALALRADACLSQRLSDRTWTPRVHPRDLAGRSRRAVRQIYNIIVRTHLRGGSAPLRDRLFDRQAR